MDDPILARARALSQAANSAASALAQMNLGKEEAPASPVGDKEPVGEKALAGGAGVLETSRPGAVVKAEFKVVAICGSSLITTHGDIRSIAPRKSVVLIEGGKYRIAERGEYTASRIQLSSDFDGPTNLDATLQVMGKQRAPSSSGKKGQHPTSEKHSLLCDDVDHGAANEVATAVASDLENLMTSLRPQPREYKRETVSAESKRRSTPSIRGAATKTRSPAAVPALPVEVGAPDGRQHRVASDPSLNVDVGVLVNQREKVRPAHNAFAKPGAPRGRVVGFGRAEGKPVDAPKREVHAGRAKVTNVYDAQVEQCRIDALERVKQKKLKEAEARRRKEEEEKHAQAERRATMQKKAEALRSATEERILRKKLEKKQNELEARRLVEEDEKRKEERRHAIQSDAAKNRIKKLNQETKERMKRRNLMEEKRRLREEQEKEEALKTFVERRGRHLPVPKARVGTPSETDGRSVYSARSTRSQSPRHIYPSNQASSYDDSPPAHADTPSPAYDMRSGTVPPPLPVEYGEDGCDYNSGRGNDADDDIRYAPEYTNQQRLADENDSPLHEGNYTTNQADDYDLSDDSIGDKVSALPEFNRRTEMESDAISTTSSLTMDESFAYSSVKSTGYGNALAAKKAHQQQQARQGGKNKVPVWKRLQPIPIQAYKPIPK